MHEIMFKLLAVIRPWFGNNSSHNILVESVAVTKVIVPKLGEVTESIMQ